MSTDDATDKQQPPAADLGLSEFIPKPMPAPIGQAPESRIGERIQAARNHFGLSVDALSRVTKAADQQEGRGVSATALLRYESAEALPGARELRLLAESLGPSVDWLITGNITEGLDAAEQELLAVLWKLHSLHARRSALGDAVAFAPEHIAKGLRTRRIIEAKRRGQP